MASRHDTMMTPPIEELLERAGSKFTLGTVVPPQVTSSARKPLSIAFEEIAADKILGSWPDPEAEADEADGEGSESAE
jgi:DNA-directed RNA polymerase subunit omega